MRWPALVLAIATVLASLAGHAADRPAIRIGWTAWADGVFVTHLAERLIETRLDRRVELVRAPIARQYRDIASGRIDVMLMSWQPRTHAPYVARVGSRVEDLGVLYDSARLGWAVPAYVPAERVASIADLARPDVRERMGARVVGIDPGAGLMRLSRRALSRYGLDGYTLEPGSGPAMTEALRDAVEQDQWIVVTGWSPHWIFAAYDLRYLGDPERVLGGSEQVHALARQGFYRDHPEVAGLIGRMWLPLDELEAALLTAENDSSEAAVTAYIEDHPKRIEYWVAGRP